MEPIVIVGIIGIVVSLVLGVKAWLESKALQERQFKKDEEARQREYERVELNEIIGWAIDVGKHGLEEPIRIEHKRHDDTWVSVLHGTGRIFDSCGDIAVTSSKALALESGFKLEALRVKGKHMELISSHNDNLYKAVKALLKLMDKEIEAYNVCSAACNDSELSNETQKLDKHRKETRKYAYEVIAQAVEIQNKELVL